MTNEWHIVRLTPEREGDFLALFDGEGFADNPAWSGCYCQCYFFEGTQEAWDARTGAENRAATVGCIRGRAIDGYLAKQGERVIGWVNAARKSAVPAFRDHETPGLDNEEVGFISCFLVAPSARGQGVARGLLRAALAGFVEAGLKVAEAKPAKAPGSAAGDYHGPLQMYLDEGFEVVGELSERNHMVRKSLS